jgi:hypothetical protein
MPTITTSDGVRLNHLEGGDPSDRAVVLIAGFRARRRAGICSWSLNRTGHFLGPGV